MRPCGGAGGGAGPSRLDGRVLREGRSLLRGPRDYHEIPGGELVLYADWQDISFLARRHLQDADAVVVTSYCPDGITASRLAFESSRPLSIFYDLDTPVTLSRIDSGEPLDHVGPEGLAGFDLVLSYTGGDALQQIRGSVRATHARSTAMPIPPFTGRSRPTRHSPRIFPISAHSPPTGRRR